jgi:hypothetical protein
MIRILLCLLATGLTAPAAFISSNGTADTAAAPVNGVPEPGTWALCSAGHSAVALRRIRRGHGR